MLPEPMSAPVSASAHDTGANASMKRHTTIAPVGPPAPSPADIPELSAPLSTDALNALHDFSTFREVQGNVPLIQSPREERPTAATTGPAPPISAGTPPRASTLAPAVFILQQKEAHPEIRNVHMLPTPAPESADKPNLGYLSPTKFTPGALSGGVAPALGVALSAPSVHESHSSRPVSPLVPVIETPRAPAPSTGLVDPEIMGVPAADISALAPPVNAQAAPEVPSPTTKPIVSVQTPAQASQQSPSPSKPSTQAREKRHSTVVIPPAAAQRSVPPEHFSAPQASSSSRAGERPKHEVRAASDPQFRWILGDYMLGKTLGAGSMGKVKLGISRSDNEKVAVKIVPRNTSVAGLRSHISRAQQGGATDVAAAAQSENAMARAVAKDKSKEVRIVREGSLQMLLRHPYVCGMHEMIVHTNHYYMVFEYINGGQMLDYIISHGRLRERSARSFARQIGSALQYCHAHNVVHRDLKIENILISKSGNIKIIDFGLSNLYSPQAQLSTFCGSLYFAAPELLNARPYRGPEVDVWSFGIVLYVLVCGKVPFDDQSMPALHAKIKRGQVEYPPWLSTECRHLLSRMLVTNPITRATLPEVLSHPWMTRGYDGPPNTFVPERKPLRIDDLDDEVIRGMTGFELGSPADIRRRLESVLTSDEYRTALEQWERGSAPPTPAEIVPLTTPESDSAMLKVARRISGIDFYRKKMHTKEPEIQPVPPKAPDPTRGYHPLISIYYLVSERIERIRLYGKSSFASSEVSLNKEPREESNVQGAPTGGQPIASILPMPTSADIPHEPPRVPEETHMSPRATSAAPAFPLPPPPRAARLSPVSEAPTPVFESRQKSQPQGVMAGPPRARAQPDELESSLRSMNIDGERLGNKGLPSMPEVTEVYVPPRRSVSLHAPPQHIRNNRASTVPPVRPIAEDDVPQSTYPSMLGVPEASMRPVSTMLPDDDKRPWNAGRSAKMDAPLPQSPAIPLSPGLEAVERPPTSMSLAPTEERAEDASADSKPVFLKGLFSVQTTSTRPRSAIRADLVRVLEQMGIQFREIRGGFECVYAPSVSSVNGTQGRSSPAGARSNTIGPPIKRDEGVSMVRTMSQPTSGPLGALPVHHEAHVTVSGEPAEPAATGIGEVGISCQAAIPPSPQPGGSNALPGLNVHFEVFVVKVPLLLGFNGLQFRRVSGNSWQYQMLARCILQELKL